MNDSANSFGTRIEALRAAVKSPALKAVLGYWLDLRQGRLMPAWNDIRPTRIARQLPIVWAYSYDRLADSFTARLAGDRIEAIFGKSFRQTPLSEIFPAGEFDDAFQRARRVVREPAAFHGEGLVFRQLQRFGCGERLMLPLASDGVHGDGILGCTEYSSIEGPYDSSLDEINEWYAL